METGEPCVIYGNVANDGIIDNLPTGCTVEVPCMVDRNGVQPTRIGSLPPPSWWLSYKQTSMCSPWW